MKRAWQTFARLRRSHNVMQVYSPVRSRIFTALYIH